jgi:WD40 repeat protein
LVCGNAHGSIRVWDTSTGALLRTLAAAHDHFVSSVNFSPAENRFMVSGGGDGQIIVWDVVSGEKVRSFEGRGSAAFAPDGRSIVAATSAGADAVQVQGLGLRV